MTAAGDEEARRAGRARAVALFRYSLIREAADPALSTRQRGRPVRELAAREHAGPFGVPVAVSRPSLDRWIRAWRSGGFDALAPPSRQVTPRTPAEVLELAAALKRENPVRTAAQVARVLRASSGWSPSERTLQRHFARLEMATRPGGSPPPAFGRFEAARCNEMWTGDALHGPVIGGRKTYLFAFIDDHSRLITGHRFGHARGHRPPRRRAAARPGQPRCPRADLRRHSSCLVSGKAARCPAGGVRLPGDRRSRIPVSECLVLPPRAALLPVSSCRCEEDVKVHMTLGIDVACRAAHQASLADETGRFTWSGRRFKTTVADLSRLWESIRPRQR